MNRVPVVLMLMFAACTDRALDAGEARFDAAISVDGAVPNSSTCPYAATTIATGIWDENSTLAVDSDQILFAGSDGVYTVPESGGASAMISGFLPPVAQWVSALDGHVFVRDESCTASTCDLYDFTRANHGVEVYGTPPIPPAGPIYATPSTLALVDGSGFYRLDRTSAEQHLSVPPVPVATYGNSPAFLGDRVAFFATDGSVESYSIDADLFSPLLGPALATSLAANGSELLDQVVSQVSVLSPAGGQTPVVQIPANQVMIGADSQRVYSIAYEVTVSVLLITPRDGSPSCTFEFPPALIMNMTFDHGSAFVLLSGYTDDPSNAEAIERIDF